MNVGEAIFGDVQISPAFYKPRLNNLNFRHVKKNWYVIYTRSKCEKKVATLLSKKGIENYCPLNRVIRQWADRKKLIYAPLFTSYVFVRATDRELYSVKLVTTDIVNFVYWLGKPAIVRDVEIDNIRKFLDEHTNVKVEKGTVQIGNMVRVLNGPLALHEGNVISVEKNKVKLSLPSLGYSIIAELKLDNVELISNNYMRQQAASG